MPSSWTDIASNTIYYGSWIFASIFCVQQLGIFTLLLPLLIVPGMIILDLFTLFYRPFSQHMADIMRSTHQFWGTDRLARSTEKILCEGYQDLLGFISYVFQDSVPPVGGFQGFVSAHILSYISATHRAAKLGRDQRRACGPITAQYTATLPRELKELILYFVLCSPSKINTFNLTPLLLSRSLRDVFLPEIYRSIHIATPEAFQGLRETLALHNRRLGKLVRQITCSSTSYSSDFSDYWVEPIECNTTLFTGIEHILVFMPNIATMNLDFFTQRALAGGDARHRLLSGPRPTTLKIEQTLIRFLPLPLYSQVTDLDIVSYGLEELAAKSLPRVLPNLRRVTIRLVRRFHERNPPVNSGSWLPWGSNGQVKQEDDEENVLEKEDEELQKSLPLWSDSPTGAIDAPELAKAIQVLRTWPCEDANNGGAADGNGGSSKRPRSRRLEHITVLTWGAALRDLQRRLNYRNPLLATDGQASSNGDPGVVRSEEELMRLVEAERCAKWAQGGLEEEDKTGLNTSEGEAPKETPYLYSDRPFTPAPLRLDLDPYRSMVARKGTLLAWGCQST